MTLLELQRRMSEDVRRPLAPGFAMQSQAEDGRSVSDLAETYIKSNDQLTSFERLEIYNRQYWFRVIGAVSEDFPALGAVLGASKFDDLVLAYLKENPSTSFTLRNLGARLPQWLESHPQFGAKRHTLLLDVARLEWAYVEAFDRAELPPLTQTDFSKFAEDSTLFMQPHLQLLALQYPVDKLVLAVHKGIPDSDIMSNASSGRRHTLQMHLPKMQRSATHLAVHRYENSVYYRRVDREAFLLLSALQQQHPLGMAIEAAFAGSKLSAGQQALKIQECFAHAAELGWFCRDQPYPHMKN